MPISLQDMLHRIARSEEPTCMADALEVCLPLVINDNVLYSTRVWCASMVHTHLADCILVTRSSG